MIQLYKDLRKIN